MSQLQPPDDIIEIEMAKDARLARFTNINVYLVIIVLILAAYVPALIDGRFYADPRRMMILLTLGIAYSLMAFFGSRWHEDHLTWWSTLTFFGVQIVIISFIFYLSRGIANQFWLLMLPIVGEGFSLNRWWGPIVIGLLLLGLFWIIFLPGTSMENMLNGTTAIVSAMLFVYLFTFIALREGQARQEIQRLATDLRQANHRLAAYAGQVEELATVRERNRLAREIHDNLGHYLTVINVQIEAAQSVMDTKPETAHDALTKAQRLTREGLSSVRQAVSTLRESPLAAKPLSEALAELIEETAVTGVDVSLSVQGDERPLRPKAALTLYRTVQEGLTNARKHAQATAVAVALTYTNPNLVTLTVHDNGRGSEAASGGFGLLGLRERVQLLGGTCTVESAPNAGFRLTVTIPDAANDEEA